MVLSHIPTNRCKHREKSNRSTFGRQWMRHCDIATVDSLVKPSLVVLEVAANLHATKFATCSSSANAVAVPIFYRQHWWRSLFSQAIFPIIECLHRTIFIIREPIDVIPTLCSIYNFLYQISILFT